MDLDKIVAENEDLIIQIQDRKQKLEEDLKNADNLKREFAIKEKITDVKKKKKVQYIGYPF